MEPNNTDPSVIGSFMPDKPIETNIGKFGSTPPAPVRSDAPPLGPKNCSKEDYRAHVQWSMRKSGWDEEEISKILDERLDEMYTSFRVEVGLHKSTLDESPTSATDLDRKAIVKLLLDAQLARGSFSLTGLRIVGVDLSGLDLRSADLRGASFVGCRFKGAVFPGSNEGSSTIALAGTSFDECDFRGACVEWVGTSGEKAKVSEWTELKTKAGMSSNSKFSNCIFGMTREERLNAEYHESKAKKQSGEKKADDGPASQAKTELPRQLPAHPQQRPEQRPNVMSRLRNL